MRYFKNSLTGFTGPEIEIEVSQPTTPRIKLVSRAGRDRLWWTGSMIFNSTIDPEFPDQMQTKRTPSETEDYPQLELTSAAHFSRLCRCRSAGHQRQPGSLLSRHRSPWRHIRPDQWSYEWKKLWLSLRVTSLFAHVKELEGSLTETESIPCA